MFPNLNKEFNGLTLDKNSNESFNLNHTLDACWMMDCNGKLIDANLKCCNLTGMDRSELIGKRFIELISPNELLETISVFQQVLNGQVKTYECSILVKDNVRIELDVMNMPIIQDEKVVGVYGIARDITSEKKKRQFLINSEKLYSNILNESLYGIAICINDRFIYANQPVLEMLGIENINYFQNATIYDFIHPINHQCVKQSLDKVKHMEKIEWSEWQISRRDGTNIFVDVKVIPTIYNNQPAVQFIWKDASERKLKEELMADKERSAIVSQFAAGIAHELRNPITAIKGFIQLINHDENQHSHYYDVIHSEIDRIEQILGELLTLSKPLKEKTTRVNLVEVIQRVVTLTKPQAIIHNIDIKFHSNLEMLMINCNPSKIKQVLLNLIKNAIEAMPDGGDIIIDLIKRKHNRIFLSVTDQGGGIPKSILEKIGTPFFTTKENGTGLGLMVCFEIIKQHNGALHIESTENGTKMSLELPLN